MLVGGLLLSRTAGSSDITLSHGDERVLSRLDGTRVSEAGANRRPLAVVVENHTEARPQVGLTEASIVYEAIAEGGITRFLAIFGPRLPEQIGPVRSARTYFVEWANDWGALFGHIGGSKQARELIRTIGLDDLDEFAIGKKAYRREPTEDVSNEHTVFLDPEQLYRVAEEERQFSVSGGAYRPWRFKVEAKSEERDDGQTITVDFGRPQYRVIWRYDHRHNSYRRYQDGRPHIDRITGRQITAKNLIVLEIIRDLVTEEGLPEVFDFRLIGKGKAQVFQDGKLIEAIWERKHRDERVTIRDQAGAELAMNPGPTWIVVENPGAVQVEVTD